MFLTVDEYVIDDLNGMLRLLRGPPDVGELESWV